MNNVPTPKNETKRLEVLQSYQILDTATESDFDDIIQLAADLCETSIAYISFIDKDRQWFKSAIGLHIDETARDTAFDAHTILESDALIIEDTLNDDQFAQNRFVTGNPHIRFYAGVPLIVENEFAIGTLCVSDSAPRLLTDKQLRGLKTLSKQVVQQLEYRKRGFEVQPTATNQNIDIEKQEARLQLALSAANIGVWEWDILTNDVIWTDNVEEVLSLEPGSFDGTFAGYQQTIHPEDKNLVNAAIQSALQGEAEYNIEHRTINGQGETGWLSAKGEVYRNENGEPIRMIGTVANITIQKTTQDEATRQAQDLQRQETRLQLALSAANIGVWEWDIPSNDVIWTDNVEEVLNLEPGSFDGTFEGYQQTIHPEDRDLVNNAIQTALSGEAEYQVEYRIINQQGEIGWSSARGEVYRNENGEPIRMIGTVANITTQKESEKAAERQANLYQQILDAIPDMVLVKKEKSAIYWANKAFREYYNMSNDELQDMIDAPFNEPDYTLQYVKDDEYVYNNGKVLYIPEELVTRYDGIVEPFNTVKAPLFDDDGKVFLTVGVSRNTTEQKEREIALAEQAEALESSQYFLDLVIDSLPARIFWKDNDGNYLGVNASFAADAGLTKKDVIGKNDFEMPWAGEQAEAFVADDQQVRESGQAKLNIVEPISTATGDQLWLETNKVPLRDTQGKIIGVLGTYQDISERINNQIKLEKQAQELAESRVFLDIVIDSLPLSIFWKDLDGHFLGVNTQLAASLGLSREEMIGKTDFEMPYSKEEAEAFIADDQAVIQSDRPKLGIIESITTATGEHLWLETNKVPLYDSSGKIVGVLGSFQDVTERIDNRVILEEQKQALESSQFFLDLVIDSLPARVFWKDNDGSYLGVNTSFAADAGLSKQDVVGKNDFELPWAETQAEAFTADDREVRESGRDKLNIIEPISTATGDQLWLETNKVPLRDPQGKIIGVLGTYQDVTERVSSQEVLQKRSAELEIITSLSTATTSAQESQQFLLEMVNFIKDSFDLYHSHIYLMNELKDTLVLSAGAGEAGRIMVEEGRRIELNNPDSLVARAARTREGVIEDDLQLAPTYLPNPLLPDSRASMAIPMVVADQVLGVLNVQADQANYFTDEDIRIQRTLAEQIGLAIQNERNQRQTAEALQELNLLTRRQTGEAWEDYIQRSGEEKTLVEYQFDGDSVATEALKESSGEEAFAQSISIYDEEIGELELGLEDMDEDTEEIVALITERLGQHLDNLRLAEQSQLRAAELQAVNQLAENISGQLNRDELLQLIFTEVKALYEFDAFTLSEITKDDLVVTLIAHESGTFFPDIPVTTLGSSSYSRKVMESREPLISQQDKVDTDELHGLADQDHTKSLIFLPIFVGQDRYVMSLQSYEYGRYNESDLPLLSGITNYIGVALQNAALFEETNQRAEQERLVNEITRKIQGTVTIEAALQTAIEELGHVFQAEYTEVKLNTDA